MTADMATLTVEQIGFVRRLTLNRPDQHNPLTPRAVREILQAVGDAENDENARVLVIRSTGRSFSWRRDGPRCGTVPFPSSPRCTGIVWPVVPIWHCTAIW